MNNKSSIKTYYMLKQFFIFIFIYYFILSPQPVVCSMSSGNYLIYADKIDTGGSFSTGGLYELEDSIGESAIIFLSGGSYELRAGYQSMERGYLSMDISNNSLDLGVLDVNSIDVALSDITISTDSETGYTLSITSVAGSGLASVSDGLVTAGDEEYGFSAIGNESLIAGDVAIVASTIVAATSSPVVSSITSLTFKASIDDNSVVGNYSQSIVMTVSANL